MKIGVFLKQVPDTESKIKIANDRIDEQGIKWVMNPYDEFALEEAIRCKEKHGGEVVIMTAGLPRVVETMRQALAIGADRGIRIDTSQISPDAWTTMWVLTEAAKKEQCDLLFAGKQAVDDDGAFVHIGIAERLQIPHVSPIEKLEWGNDAKRVTVSRPLPGGFKEMIEVELPALFGCEKGLNTPRYASLPGILKAKSKPIAEYAAQDLLGSVKPLTALSKYELPPEGRKGKMLSGTPAEMAKTLVHLLREEAKVI